MRIRWPTPFTLVLLLIVTAGLMIGAMRQESATVDETGFLGAGYSYWHGHRYRLNPSHPPLAQLLASLPLTVLDAKLSPLGSAILSGRMMADPSTRWDLREGGPPLSTPELFPHGPGFYHFPFDEQIYFGGDFIYGGQNDAEKFLFWGRIPEVLLTLLTGLMVFLWARHLQGDAAGLLAASMLLLNPVILAYGHIVQTDIGMALAFPLAVWMFARLLEAPSARRAVCAGLAAGVTLAIKYTAVILLPTFVVLWLLYRWRHRGAQSLGWKRGLLVAAVAWGLIALLYMPHWLPAPPIDAATAAKLAVPHWFVLFRPILIPAEYFKGLAITLLHASGGNEAYLNGAWSNSGWWYYFPLAFAMKTPLTFLLFAGVGIALAVRSRRELRFAELAAWAGAAVYLLCAMWSKANLGVRHILAVYPLVSIGAASALSRWTMHVPKARQKLANWAVAALPVASLAGVLLAYPQFISYMNPLAGGSKHGHEHLLDSNFDWGQDVKRLKQFLDEHGSPRIYLQYFGTQAAIEYYGIANDFVGSDVAKQIQQGPLVVSANALMRPEWQWLRESHQPVARVGYTLFVYQIGGSGKAADPGN
jgi:4-amino-4-deoxy-L-arabinose transferase-like glycosyltransferase